MQTITRTSKYGKKYCADQILNWSVSKPSDQIKMQNEILFDAWQDVSNAHLSEADLNGPYVLIGVVFYNSGTNSFISVPEIYCGYMVMELVAIDEVKRIHVGADKIAKEQGL